MLQVAKQGDLISSESEKKVFRLMDLCPGPLGVTQDTGLGAGSPMKTHCLEVGHAGLEY